MFLKTQNIFQKTLNYIKWLFMLYELNTQISICEPWERVFSHILLLFGAAILIYIMSYIPIISKAILMFVLNGDWQQDSTTNSFQTERYT